MVKPHILSEALLTFVYIYILDCTLMSLSNVLSEKHTLSGALLLSFVHSAIYSVCVYISMSISRGLGGYLNPIITIGTSLVKMIYTCDSVRWSILFDGLSLILAQAVSTLGATLLAVVTTPYSTDGLEPAALPNVFIGETHVSSLVLNSMLCNVLVLTCLSVRINEPRRASCIIACTMFSIQVLGYTMTGGIINPLRYIGSLIIGGRSNHLFVHCFSPFFGSIIGVSVFIFLRDVDITQK